MTETVPFYSTAIPLAFFIWGPVLVVLLFWAVGVWSNRQGVPRMLESDWDGYSVADVEKLFTLYGEDKRARYRNRVLPADVACAFTYAIVGALIVAGLAMRGQPWWVAALCGGGWLLGGLCDVAENFAVARLLDRYPQVDGGNVAFASAMTRVKLVLFALGVIGALAAAYIVFKPLAG
ncbi:MAG: hypothetical protein J0I42_01055 [Bosea sp.]|uniref:hypothetical protein n=1 Tax=Bosea sp. (in: a-proteobacteria) TaxID=1871050 RepID=UPI001ACC18D0|nr:hypothetical protein [Bosea sp. (in: a-proteobacteria)]MBN9450510.1 hypothetical protein [Bosea sp. (in: a-proteobacteria)]